MNTGMQDAVNLAWKLALATHGSAAEEPLLESYDAERSGVGQQVLQDAGRLTMLATLRSGILQEIRNHVASFVFGLSPVRHAMAAKLTELGIGYPGSPLTVASHGTAHPSPGERAIVAGRSDPAPVETTPRFTLFADPDADIGPLLERHRELLAPELHPPFEPGRLWLVRPDGYVALVAAAGDWSPVDRYLARLRGL